MNGMNELLLGLLYDVMTMLTLVSTSDCGTEDFMELWQKEFLLISS